MSKLISPMSGRIVEINVKAGQMISKDEEVIIIEDDNENKKMTANPYDQDEFPQYQMLYEYLTARYFSIV